MADASEYRDFDEARLYLPEPETVTLTRPESLEAGPEEVVTVANVQAQPIDDVDVDALGGTLYGNKRTFHFWAAECEGLVPGEGWFIGMDDGTTWRILSAEVLAHGRRYRVKTIQKQG